MNCVWSLSEKEYISRNASTMKDIEIAEKLRQLTGRKISLQSLRKQRRKLGIFKQCGRGICKLQGNDAVSKGTPCVPPKQPQ